MIDSLLQFVLLCLHILKVLYYHIRGISSERTHLKPPHVHHRLSKRTDQVKASYDVVVIGSGYGGSIAACRMSRASPRQSVCVLERGEERWPGEFPRGVRTAIAELKFTGCMFGWIPVEIGKATALYRWILGRASSVLVGSGLGGTSLINAGVWMRPDTRVLESDAWPKEIRTASQALDTYLERAERMLQPTICPENVRKFDVLQQQARAVGIGAKCKKATLMTSFKDRTNSAGVKMRRSKMDGQDCMGLNDGSKNSTLVTYLADAEKWGAEIFCGCEVGHIAEHPLGGYCVYYRRLGPDDSRHSMQWIHAKQFVFLGAGSIGTTEIMLRSKDRGLSLSPRAGSGLTSNGGMLAFGYDLDRRVNTVGTPQPSPTHPPGPTIVGTIDCRDTTSVEHGFVIQDGAFPIVMTSLFRLVHWFLPCIAAPGVRWTRTIWKHVCKDVLQYSQIYLVLGHDNSGGRLSLKDGKPVLDMRDVRDIGHLASARDLLTRMTHAFGGSFKSQGVRVCVHPLGGMGLASDGTGDTGATAHTGQVFTGEGKAVHEGLVVVDGALIPRSLGTNPVATIASLAERSIDLLASQRGLGIDVESFEPPGGIERRPKDESTTFSEVMEGKVLDAQRSDPITLAMTIRVQRYRDKFQGSVTGTMHCPMFSKDPLIVEKGHFRLFETNDSVPFAKKMIYDLQLVDSTGKKVVFRGEKVLSPAMAFSLRRTWAATTTMSASIRLADEDVVAQAELRLRPNAFLRQLRSLRVDAGKQRRRLLLDFIRSFALSVAEFVLVPFTPLQYSKQIEVEPTSDNLTRPAVDAQHIVKARDGFQTPLRMWNPPGPSNGKDLLFVPGGAVTHEIYSLSTVRKNAIEHFTSLAYRCWCITHRAATVKSQDRRHGWTTYDARLDIEAALLRIRELNGNQAILVVAHCVGSGAFASALLEGLIPSSWIRGIVASQFFLHPLVSPLNQWKARLPLVPLYRMFAGDWYDCHSSKDDEIFQRLLNLLLRWYPHTSRQELCRSNLCHRTDLPFGRLWNHANLNRETHDRLDELFNGVSTNCIEHLANMGLKATLTDNVGRDLVTEGNVERLRGIPIFLLVGNDNQVYQTRATLLTLQLLTTKFGGDGVRQMAFEGLGHLDCWMSDAAAAPGGVYETVGKELLRM